MKYDFNSYLFYESSAHSPLTVKIKIGLSVKINGEVLKKSAQKAFMRYPYYAHTLEVDDEGAYILKPCTAPISVKEEGAPCVLGSEETNGLFFAVTYSEDAIFFNFFHGFCGACGAMPWLKTTIWQYLTDMGFAPSSEGIYTPGSALRQGETDLPDCNTFGDELCIGEYTGGDSFLPIADYRAAYRDIDACSRYYPIVIPKDALMKYVSENDGSPNSIISAALFKMSACLFPDEEQFAARIACNYRADVGCPNTYRDLVRMLHVKYKKRMKDWTIEKLSTITRGAMFVQMQPELSRKEYKELMEFRNGIDQCATSDEKRGYAAECSLLHKGPKDTYTISYVGKMDWGGISEYVTSAFTLTEGHLILEINAVENQFCISFMTYGRDAEYLGAFLAVLEEEGIPYKVGELEKRNMPKMQLK